MYQISAISAKENRINLTTVALGTVVAESQIALILSASL